MRLFLILDIKNLSERARILVSLLSPIFLLIQIQLVRLLVASLVGLLVGKPYHTNQKDGYNSPTNDPTNDRTNWIWMSKKIGLKRLDF